MGQSVYLICKISSCVHDAPLIQLLCMVSHKMVRVNNFPSTARVRVYMYVETRYKMNLEHFVIVLGRAGNERENLSNRSKSTRTDGMETDRDGWTSIDYKSAVQPSGIDLESHG